MDETRLDNQTQWQHGMYVKRKCYHGVAPEFVPAQPRERRRSLLAALCSSSDLQRHLPQVVIHKDAGASGAASATQPARQAGGADWSNKTGTIDIKTLRRWVYTIRCKVDAYAPTSWIVLVLDCCPVHISQNFLRYCCRVGVLLLILPARCTWFVQPLDVYVFGPLKRKLAHARAMRRIANSSASLEDTVPWQKQQQAEATAFLSRADGARDLARCGVHLDVQTWRQPLLNLVVGCDLKARPPSADELALLLGRSPAQAARMLPLLLSWPQRLQNSSVPSNPPRTYLPAPRPAMERQCRAHGHTMSSTSSLSATSRAALPHAIRLGPPLNRPPPRPALAADLGPAHGTRSQTAIRGQAGGS